MVDLRLGAGLRSGRGGPSAERIAFALGRVAPGLSRGDRPARCAPSLAFGRRLYFAVRSIAADARGHVLQYAFADDDGRIVIDAMARTPSPVALVLGAADGEAPHPTVDAARLEEQVATACRGARLVAYHRVLQGGLAPPAGLAVASGVDCAWRRFQQTARRRGLRLERGAPRSLDDSLALAGLPAPAGDDAAERALAVRALWLWMDAME